MKKDILKKARKDRRKNKVRAKILGKENKLRLNVFKSNTQIYAQIIDDLKGTTLVSASTKDVSKNKFDSEICFELGKVIARKAIDKKIEFIVFDRAGNKYHGKIKSLADGAREGGLKF